jgi:hypothetical protein
VSASRRKGALTSRTGCDAAWRCVSAQHWAPAD